MAKLLFSLSKVLTEHNAPLNHTNHHETQITKLDLVLFRVGSWIFSFGCGSAALSNLRNLWMIRYWRLESA